MVRRGGGNSGCLLNPSCRVRQLRSRHCEERTDEATDLRHRHVFLIHIEIDVLDFDVAEHMPEREHHNALRENTLARMKAPYRLDVAPAHPSYLESHPRY